MSRQPGGVGLVIANDRLRRLVRTYIERNGFRVVFAVPQPDPALADPDIAVTEAPGVRGRFLTVRITEALAMPDGDAAIVLAPDELSAPPELLDVEIRERSCVV